MATLDDFSKIDIRIGRVENVEDVEKARKPIYKLTIDFGQEIGTRTILAGIKDFYTKEELKGKQIACIVNLEPKVIAGIESQGMILAGDGESGPAVLMPSKEAALGSRVH